MAVVYKATFCVSKGIHGKFFSSFDLFKPKEIKFLQGNLAEEKSVTLAKN